MTNAESIEFQELLHQLTGTGRPWYIHDRRQNLVADHVAYGTRSLMSYYSPFDAHIYDELGRCTQLRSNSLITLAREMHFSAFLNSLAELA